MEESEVNENDILPGCSTFEDYVQAAYPIVMNGVRLSNNLPNAQQFSYFKTYPEFEEIMKKQGDQLQNSIQTILKFMGTKRNIRNQPSHEKFELIVDTNDKLLDRAHKSMSHMDGTRQNPDEDFGESPKKIAGCWNKTGVINIPEAENKVKLTVQQRTIRPQALFKDKIDNSNRPWMPRIKEKPNSLKPLSVLPTVNDNGEETYTHPYEYEIDMWKPSEERQSIQEIQEPKDIDKTDLKYIETESELELMLTDLKKYKIIGVDLEHHSYRSFMGFTCLMQISTQDTDYIIDTLKLRHKMHILNVVFTKPDVLKIFHGAVNDIEWLQRDLSLYIVNMFDTYQAAKVLEFPKLSLSHLLKHYCQIDVSKKYQLYDWRIRPLNEKAQNYARQDTHYLIYVYQLMNNELFNKAEGSRLINVVYQKSAETCKKVYMKPLLDENSHMNLYRRMQRPFDTRQLFALKEIYKWRDQIARQEDESPGYVLSNHMMMQIAQTLPREAQGVLACCNPIPPLVRQHVLDIHNIILKAKEVPLVKTIPENSGNKGSDYSTNQGLDLEMRLNYFTHDNTGIEYRDDLPTVLNGKLKNLGEPPNVEPSLSILTVKNEEKVLSEQIMKISFISPYERYIKVLPYSIQQEKIEFEKQQIKDAEIAERRNKIQNMGTSALKRTQGNKDEQRFAGELPSKKIHLSPQSPVRTEEKIDNLLSSIKKEVDVKNRKKHKRSNTDSLGVIGGEISKSKKNKQDMAPYDYTQVDFTKFQSRPQNQNQPKQNQQKRKKQFQGKHQLKKKKGHWW